MSIEEENEEYFQSQEFRHSLARYEDALRQGEPIYMEADELTDIAEYYMTREREQDADKVINLALALHPDSVDPQVFLARRQLFVGNTQEAWQISQAIIDQEDLEVKYLNAEIFIKEGRYREAVVYLLNVWRYMDDDRDQFLYDSAVIFMDYNQWR
ncbi:MAG: tetratricopeptide repeat protein, partial [Bacteroidaceae bacterium]